MIDTHTIFRWLHIALGFMVLASFWIPMFAKKGSRVHVYAGRFYGVSMAVVLLSAAVLCVIRLLQADYFLAMMLGFLTLLSFNALFQGLSFARYKKLTPLNKNIIFYTVLAIFLWAIPLLYLGIKGGHILFIIFGAIGVLTTPADLKRFNPFQKDQPHPTWIESHITGMVISAGAAYTAFFAFGARMFGFEQGDFGVLPWVLPTVLAVTFVVYYTRQYKQVARKPK